MLFTIFIKQPPPQIFELVLNTPLQYLACFLRTASHNSLELVNENVAVSLHYPILSAINGLFLSRNIKIKKKFSNHFSIPKKMFLYQGLHQSLSHSTFLALDKLLLERVLMFDLPNYTWLFPVYMRHEHDFRRNPFQDKTEANVINTLKMCQYNFA